MHYDFLLDYYKSYFIITIGKWTIESFIRLLQILPSLESGGVEQGTVDVANYIASKGLDSFIASSGGNMLRQLNRNKIHHTTLPLYSKNLFTNFTQKLTPIGSKLSLKSYLLVCK